MPWGKIDKYTNANYSAEPFEEILNCRFIANKRLQLLLINYCRCVVNKMKSVNSL